MSQLRSLAREAGTGGTPLSLAHFVRDVHAVARALCEPTAAIARSTGRARLVAVQRFFTVMGPVFGRDADATIARLDALLPVRPRTGWHDAGTLVAGSRARRRLRGPTLFPLDLLRIVESAADTNGGFRAARDHLLVALHCLSGLRAEEIVALQWEQIGHTSAGEVTVTFVRVRRRDQPLHLTLPPLTIDAVMAFAEVVRGSGAACTGAVFRHAVDSPQSLRYRAVRDIVARACNRAGYGAVASATLRAAFAAWLRSRGLSDHEVASVLGLARVRSVDRLLAPHAALAAQRAVRERMG